MATMKGPEGQRPGDIAVPRAAAVLGGGGLIPFAALALALWLAPATWADNLAAALIGYAVVILAFMGGCRWGFAAAGLGAGPAWRPLAISVLPALYGWAVASLPAAAAMAALAAGFAALLAADIGLTRAGGAPGWWPALRWPLTLGAAGSLLVGSVAIALG
ncbi:MAG: DUF3429 domain-containing protein [Pikeienuella sp.]